MATGNFSKGTYKYPSLLIFYADGHIASRFKLPIAIDHDEAFQKTQELFNMLSNFLQNNILYLVII